jgi:putative DNA primase/helicase
VITELKARVSLRDLVSQTHAITRSKVLCPAHADTHPSCHLYQDHLYCFACGWRGDALDWLMEARMLSFDDALAELRRLAAVAAPVAATGERSDTATPASWSGGSRADRPTRVAPSDDARFEVTLTRHRRLAEQLHHVPAALRGRGFTLTDLRRLGVAAIGETAVLPLTDPDGNVVALKQRFDRPRAGQRYRYLTPGRGAPPWCSPGFGRARLVLVIEGELNGMAAWLARPTLGVMGVAGVGGPLLADALTGKLVFVHADFDEAGVSARARWCALAHEAGALRVRSLEPWRDGDACEVAGSKGREALRWRLPR